MRQHGLLLARHHAVETDAGRQGGETDIAVGDAGRDIDLHRGALAALGRQIGRDRETGTLVNDLDLAAVLTARYREHDSAEGREN